VSNLPAPVRRLIEVDLPIKAISAIARREKLSHHGSLATLHIWWARRPPAACRAVLAGALWPDPCDPACPDAFRQRAAEVLASFAEQARTVRDVAELAGSRWSFWREITFSSFAVSTDEGREKMQHALLEFVVLYAEPKAAQNEKVLAAARRLTEAAHGTGVVTWDPFAGGGAIPVEGLRLGTDVIACDLNPVAVMLNRVALEYAPKHGEALKSAFSTAAASVGQRLRDDLSAVYPRRESGTPIVYLWAREIRCEGPGCGVGLPLIRNLQITRDSTKWHFELDPKGREVVVRVRKGASPRQKATVAGGSAVCPCCNFTTKASNVREQLRAQRGGAASARLLAVYVDGPGGRAFMEPTAEDKHAASELAVARLDANSLPIDPINSIRPYKNTRGLSAVTRVGIERFGDLYTPRQALVLQRLRTLVAEVDHAQWSPDLRRAVQTLLLCAMSRLVFQNCSLSRWHAGRSTVEGAFGKQALQVVWDFAESNPVSDGPANWDGAVEWIEKVLDALQPLPKAATVLRNAAQDQVLPDDSVDVLFTDPPYFAAIPYSDLSNVFFVWERELLRTLHPDLYSEGLVQQEREIIVTEANQGPKGRKKDPAFFYEEMTKSLQVARRAVKPNGIGIVVFADSTTDAWEAILGAIIDAGWKITGSWAIDTELQNRTQASGSASLQSSIHIVCRPREDLNGDPTTAVGEWKEVLAALRARLHSWLPRLARENVVGADALFACLGPSLECFSQYSSVEKVNGERVLLKEYLEHVWSAISREALAMIFDDADTSGLEEDARLTAMWLWTLSSGTKVGDDAGADDADEDDDENDATATKSAGFTLEFDAARKIAQGLGARLDEIDDVVEVKGDKARLLSVTERTACLFGKTESAPSAKKAAKKKQMTLFGELDAVAEVQGWGEVGAPKAGTTTLDRVHQAMLLFGSGRGEALKRFIVEEGVGKQPQFWKLAQSLSALYPSGTDEKRWVDGVLARKKGLGF
jgi:adenine-specific DNA methylase